MKIAFFTDSYEPQINGMVTSIKLYSKYLRKKDHEIIIFAPAVSGYKDKESFVQRFRSVELPSYREYRIAIPYKTLLKPKLINLECDVVNIHSPFSLGVLGLGIAKKNKIPIVGTFHTLFPEYIHYLYGSDLVKYKRISSFLKKSSWKYLAWFYNRCDAVISPSEEIAEAMRKNGIRKEIVVIPTGIEIQNRKNSKNSLRKKHGFASKNIILHVGRVTKEKNIEFIINSLKSMLNNQTILIITSDGPYKNYLKNLCKKHGIQENVIFTGYLSKETLADYYKMADVFVMASKTETQGIVLFEAMMYGVPVVVLDSPITGSFVKRHRIGIVASKNNFCASVKTMVKANKKRKEYILAGKKSIKKYDIRKSTKDLIELYERLSSKSINYQ